MTGVASSPAYPADPPSASLPADPRDSLILALDFPSAAATFSFLDPLEASGPRLRWVKVGLELYLAAGGAVVDALKQRGYRVFLDLKLHDIPNTVAGALRTLRALEPDMITLHAAGGAPMMAAAIEAAASWRTRLLAVTVLTSMDTAQLNAVGVSGTPSAQAIHLAHLAAEAGVTGLVASAQDARPLRAELPAAHIVTPGIRSLADVRGDQQRTATAADALRAGADQLVIGRPITHAADPRLALDTLLQEMETALRAEESPAQGAGL